MFNLGLRPRRAAHEIGSALSLNRQISNRDSLNRLIMAV